MGVFGGGGNCLPHIVLEHIQLIQGFLTGTALPQDSTKAPSHLNHHCRLSAKKEKKKKNFLAVCFAVELCISASSSGLQTRKDLWIKHWIKKIHVTLTCIYIFFLIMKAMLYATRGLDFHSILRRPRTDHLFQTVSAWLFSSGC